MTEKTRKRKRLEKERLLNCYQERTLEDLSLPDALFISSSSHQPDNYKKFSLDRNKCLVT